MGKPEEAAERLLVETMMESVRARIAQLKSDPTRVTLDQVEILLDIAETESRMLGRGEPTLEELVAIAKLLRSLALGRRA